MQHSRSASPGGRHAALAMGEKKLRAKLTKELGREPTADELTTASKLLKAKKQAAADAPVTPTVPLPPSCDLDQLGRSKCGTRPSA
jgi:hypothetical protein